MTIGDYIQEKLSLWSVDLSDELIALELKRVGLNSSDDIAGEINFDNFFYNVIPDFILIPSSISEGGFSVGRNKDAIEAYYASICQRTGKSNLLVKNTIIDITSKWG